MSEEEVQMNGSNDTCEETAAKPEAPEVAPAEVAPAEAAPAEATENESAPEKVPNKTAKTVASILQRVKDDTEMTSEEKINTLSMLLGKFVEENGVLKNEIDIILEQMKKHVEHKNTLKMMNDALKRQVDLVKEESELKLKVCIFST